MESYHGRGYGTVAFGAMARYASEKLGLHCKARCYQVNSASYKMITDNGFVKAGQDDEFYYFEYKEN